MLTATIPEPIPATTPVANPAAPEKAAVDKPPNADPADQIAVPAEEIAVPAAANAGKPAPTAQPARIGNPTYLAKVLALPIFFSKIL